MNTQHPHPDIDTACQNAAAAFAALAQLAPDARAAILDAIAAALEARRAEILTTCSEETALTIEELTPEFARTTGTLRMFADLVRDGSWVRAAIDTPSISPLGPNHDLRSMLVPLGPVAVFGSSNFPLAYGVCGGDTASALAAGCPIIVKEHPAHPRTGRLLANIAQQAIAHTFDEPDAQARTACCSPSLIDLLQYLPNKDPNDLSVAQQLVQHPLIKAVGFTGSIPGGLAIEKLARERRIPIPVFAEMGSNNVVIITTDAASAAPDSIADEIAGSILQRFGQQCTRPGTVVVPPGEIGDILIRRLSERISASPSREMLSPWIRESYERRSCEVRAIKGTRLLAEGVPAEGQRAARARLFAVDGAAHFAKELQEEIFGPAAIVVRQYPDRVSELGIFAALTYSFYIAPSEIGRPNDWRFDHAIQLGPRAAGRITFNSPPTGVRVATSMVHGGPFPATNAPQTTAVGPRAIERWCRPICFQNCPDELLPPELQNANPRCLSRIFNGVPNIQGC